MKKNRHRSGQAVIEMVFGIFIFMVLTTALIILFEIAIIRSQAVRAARFGAFLYGTTLVPADIVQDEIKKFLDKTTNSQLISWTLRGGIFKESPYYPSYPLVFSEVTGHFKLPHSSLVDLPESVIQEKVVIVSRKESVT